jgi:hypothetical protein
MGRIVVTEFISLDRVKPVIDTHAPLWQSSRGASTCGAQSVAGC